MDAGRVLFLVGRILFGGYFLLSGVNHFTKTAGLTQYAASKGVPSSELLVLATGALLVLGALSVLLGVRPKWGLTALLVFLVPVSLSMHAFWAEPEPLRTQDQMAFLRNMALIGACLGQMLVPEPWPLSLEEGRRPGLLWPGRRARQP